MGNNSYVQAYRPGGRANMTTYGGKCWFVDYDNGTPGSAGDDPTRATKHLQEAIDLAGKQDIIYIRPREADTAAGAGDPKKILPASTANWTVAHAKHGLALIGTGYGGGKAGAYFTNLQASTTAQATATLEINAPYVTVENLTFRRGSGTLCGIELSNDATATASNFGCTLYNCLFWKFGSTATKGAVYILGTWHHNILNCYFEECAKGIEFDNSVTEVGTIIRDCQFNGADTTIDVDIYAYAAVSNILIDRCVFSHDIPALSGGSHLRYIKFATASGMLSNCTFGSEGSTLTTNLTISNIDVVNCNYAAGTNFSTY